MSSTQFLITAERDPHALEALRPEWEALAASALEPNPFFEHWLLIPALRAFGAGEDIRVVCVRRNDRLCGVFPFQYMPRYRGLPAKALVAWRNPHGLLGTPLVARDGAAECLLAMLEWVRQKRLASLVQMSHVPAGGPFEQALVDALNQGDHPSRISDVYTRGLLRRSQGADEYIESALSADSRQKLRRSETRLQVLGRVTHRVIKPGDDVYAWIDEFLRVEASGWKGAQGTALSCSEADRRFVHEAFAAAFNRGRLIMVGIDLDDQPIARYSGFVAREGAFAFKTGYDESFKRFGPGLLAELDMVRAFHALPGVTWMDSITGPSNSTINRLWKHRMVVQRLEVGLDALGEFVVLALLPFLQWSRRRLRAFSLLLQADSRIDEAVRKPKPTTPAAG